MGQKAECQTAVVTGAGGAFGQEIVRQLLAKGFCVAATDTSEDHVKTLSDLPEYSGYIKAFVMDVSDKKSVSDAAEKIRNAFSAPVAVLVNNAGILGEKHILLPDSPDVAEDVISVNLIGAFNCTSAFGRFMLNRRFGRIINIASVAGIIGTGGGSAYAASKGGLIAATKSWANELAQFGITVNAIAPGICKTAMLDHSEGAARFEALMTPMIPLRRLGTPFDVAELTVFLASSKSNYINGEVITVDGGLLTGTFNDEFV